MWDGKYWIYPSTDEAGSQSWGEMQRWHCYSSEDLVNWKCEGEIFNLDDVEWADRKAYAPDAVRWQGRYYFFFPANYAIGVAMADKLFYHVEGASPYERRVCVDYLFYNEDGTIREVKMTRSGVEPLK